MRISDWSSDVCSSDLGGYAATLCSQPNQIAALELKDFRRALAQLPPEQREALVLIGASGFSYEDAAHICGCAIGTMKSRVNRGRNRLADLLQIRSEEHTSELQSLMRISYAVFRLKK